MLKATGLTCLFFVLAYITQAQTLVWDKNADDAIKNSKRLIVLQVDPTDLPDDKKIQKRKDWVHAFEKYCADFNAGIEKPIRDHWRLTKQVDFMSIDAAMKLREKMPGKERASVLVLYFLNPEYNFMYATGKLSAEELSAFTVEKGKPEDDVTQPVYLFTLDNISRFDENEIFAAPAKALCTYSCNRWFVTPGEMAFVVENMQDMLQVKAKGNRERYHANFENANKGKLAGKTLLIPEDYTIKAKGNKKTISDQAIKKAYPMPWRFASWKEIDAAIDQKDQQYAVLFSTWFNETGTDYGTYFWAVDATDARTILGYSTPGNKSIGIGTVAKEQDLYDLNERRVEEIVKQASAN